MTYRITTLPNGLRVASEYLPGVETVTVAVACGVGARNEEESENGISHVLEHMAFKGTKTRSARMLAEMFDDMGGHSNAYTSMETTVYHAKVMRENLHAAVDILGDILTQSVFDPEELAREQQVILQEIAMQQDTPDDLVFDMFTLAAYPDQPLGRSILGPPENVSAITRERLFDYLAKHYTPTRLVVTAAGNLDHEDFCARVAEHFAGLSAREDAPSEAGYYRGGEARKADDLEQLHLVLGCEGVSYHDPDYYAAQLLTTILGGGMSSRLFQEIREKRGLVYHVSASLSSYRDSGIFAVYAGLSGDKAPEFMPVTCDELLRASQGVTTAELARAKTQFKAGLLMARESTSSVAEWIGRHLLHYGRYRPAHEVIATVDSITPEDIRRVAVRLFGSATLSLAALGPVSGVEVLSHLQQRFN